MAKAFANLGKKKQHKHKLFGPDFPRTFLTLTPGRPWVKKFLPSTGAAEKRTFWCGHPRFLAWTSMTRRVFEKLCTKKVCVDFLAPKDGGYRGKISVVDMVFLVFIGFLYPPPAWKVFLWGQKSSPTDFLSVVVVSAFFFSVSSTSWQAKQPEERIRSGKTDPA